MAKLLAVTVVIPDDARSPVSIRVVTSATNAETTVKIETLDLRYSAPEELARRIADQFAAVCSRQ